VSQSLCVFCSLLSIPVTVASGECSFSKLKLIKTYLRYTMAHGRLAGLAMLSIENDIASCLDYSEVVTKFAAIKAPKVCLSLY
jgi:hAT family C-terminal dimerisation region